MNRTLEIFILSLAFLLNTNSYATSNNAQKPTPVQAPKGGEDSGGGIKKSSFTKKFDMTQNKKLESMFLILDSVPQNKSSLLIPLNSLCAEQDGKVVVTYQKSLTVPKNELLKVCHFSKAETNSCKNMGSEVKVFTKYGTPHLTSYELSPYKIQTCGSVELGAF